MEFITLTLSPPSRTLHPIDTAIRDHEAVERRLLLHVDAGPLGTTILVYRLTGDRRSFETALDDERVHTYELVDCDDGGFHAFVQAGACESGGELLEVAHQHGLIIETPLEFVEGGLRAMLVGPDEALRRALRALPDDLDVAVENAGTYRPGNRELLSPLTDRQLEVVRTAVEEGYYEIPRRVTRQDIADTLDCTASTVDDHLRRAEARVVTGLIQ